MEVYTGMANTNSYNTPIVPQKYEMPPYSSEAVPEIDDLFQHTESAHGL
jgi:hypothetical protein